VAKSGGGRAAATYLGDKRMASLQAATAYRARGRTKESRRRSPRHPPGIIRRRWRRLAPLRFMTPLYPSPSSPPLSLLKHMALINMTLLYLRFTALAHRTAQHFTADARDTGAATSLTLYTIPL